MYQSKLHLASVFELHFSISWFSFTNALKYGSFTLIDCGVLTNWDQTSARCHPAIFLKYTVELFWTVRTVHLSDDTILLFAKARSYTFFIV